MPGMSNKLARMEPSREACTIRISFYSWLAIRDSCYGMQRLGPPEGGARRVEHALTESNAVGLEENQLVSMGTETGARGARAVAW